jgi:ketosteroid isomerase-like protein
MEEDALVNTAMQTIVDRWIEAERANDSHALAGVLADDFLFVGRAGFILNKDQFLGCFDSGDLKTTSFNISGLNVRERENLAVAIGVWGQETTYQGRPNNGNFRLTMIFTGDRESPQVLGAQLSPMMGPA